VVGLNEIRDSRFFNALNYSQAQDDRELINKLTEAGSRPEEFNQTLEQVMQELMTVQTAVASKHQELSFAQSKITNFNKKLRIVEAYKKRELRRHRAEYKTCAERKTRNKEFKKHRKTSRKVQIIDNGIRKGQRQRAELLGGELPAADPYARLKPQGVWDRMTGQGGVYQHGERLKYDGTPKRDPVYLTERIYLDDNSKWYEKGTACTLKELKKQSGIVKAFKNQTTGKGGTLAIISINGQDHEIIAKNLVATAAEAQALGIDLADGGLKGIKDNKCPICEGDRKVCESSKKRKTACGKFHWGTGCTLIDCTHDCHKFTRPIIPRGQRRAGRYRYSRSNDAHSPALASRRLSTASPAATATSRRRMIERIARAEDALSK